MEFFFAEMDRLPARDLLILTRHLRQSLESNSTRQLLRCDIFLEGRKHKGGCIHSDTPEYVISVAAKEDDHGAKRAVKRELASSIFFKRCDGRYKNMKRAVSQM